MAEAARTGSSRKGGSKKKKKTPVLEERIVLEETVASWDEFLHFPRNADYVAPVSYFRYAPMADEWEESTSNAIGRSIELPNPYVVAENGPIYWIAVVKQFAGYKALVEFERFGKPPVHACWITFWSDVPKPLGYSTPHNILLYPMADIEAVYPNYVEKLGENHTASRTIKGDHIQRMRLKVMETRRRYPLNSKVEALDRTLISRVRVGKVTGHIGDRIHVTYAVEPVPKDEGFVFSIYSDYVHPIGWANEVGHEIFDPVELVKPFPMDTLLPYPPDVDIEVGQLLEARHPLDPYAISEASVSAVYKHGYFQVSFKSSDAEIRRPTRYTYHVSSPLIFPAGFCERNGISLRKRSGKVTGESAKAPLHLLPSRPLHKFSEGHKLESIDVCDPGYLGPMTVVRVVEHMLLLHYDGWPTGDAVNTIWMPADSPDIYPLGYAELTGHKFHSCPALPKKLSVKPTL